MLPEALQNTTIPAIFVSHKRGLDVIHPNKALLRIQNVSDRETAMKYVKNAVVFVNTNKNGETTYNKGVITKTHGRKGAVRAKFERNLCPQAIGEILRVKLYKLCDLKL